MTRGYNLSFSCINPKWYVYRFYHTDMVFKVASAKYLWTNLDDLLYDLVGWVDHFVSRQDTETWSAIWPIRLYHFVDSWSFPCPPTERIEFSTALRQIHPANVLFLKTYLMGWILRNSKCPLKNDSREKYIYLEMWFALFKK